MSSTHEVEVSVAGKAPGRHATLTMDGDQFVIEVARPFLEEPAQARTHVSEDGRSMRVDIGGIPETVTDFEPRTLWAILDGQPCTLLDAKMGVKHKGFDLIQTYGGSRLLRGAHLDGEDALVEGVRMVLPVPGAGWSGDPPITTELGTVRAWSGQRGPGIGFRPAEPVRVWDLTQHTKSDITVLPRLWSSRDDRHTQVEWDCCTDR